MTYEELIKNLQYLISEDYTDTQMDYVEEIEIAINAIDKQIPKKPNCKIYTSDTRCPICNIPLCIGSNYCINCGQKIDWRDAE